MKKKTYELRSTEMLRKERLRNLPKFKRNKTQLITAWITYLLALSIIITGVFVHNNHVIQITWLVMIPIKGYILGTGVLGAISYSLQFKLKADFRDYLIDNGISENDYDEKCELELEEG